MSSFNFKLIETREYLSQKDNKLKAIIVCYCSYGFIANIYTTIENKNKLIELSKDKDFDLNKYINVMYDKTTDKFRYFIKFN